MGSYLPTPYLQVAQELPGDFDGLKVGLPRWTASHGTGSADTESKTEGSRTRREKTAARNKIRMPEHASSFQSEDYWVDASVTQVRDLYLHEHKEFFPVLYQPHEHYKQACNTIHDWTFIVERA